MTLLSCADRLATRAERRAGRGGPPRPGARADARRLDWRESGPPRSPLRGHELARELGIEPGPELGRLLAQLQEAAYAGEATDRAQALELARKLRDNPGL